MGSRVLSRLFEAKQLFKKPFNYHKTNSLTYSQLKQTKQFSTTNQLKSNDDENTKSDPFNLSIVKNSKYKTFSDKDSQTIFDVTEEQERIKLEDLNELSQHDSPYAELNMERGIYGVYDIEDLIPVLKKDNAKQIFVASVPSEYSYVDYIVIVTAKSQKHMQALAQFVRKVYKMKKHKKDLIPKIEGEKSKDWIAMDLGNIVLHIFCNARRRMYDLETLWSVGSEYDDKTNKPVDMNIMDQYNAFLINLEPADSNKIVEDQKI